jgi:hypothetical protein
MVMGSFKELPLIVTSLVADLTSFDVVVAFVVEEDFSIFFQIWMHPRFLLLLFIPELLHRVVI